MTVTVNNSLSGAPGVSPSVSSLSSTARAGSVGITAPARAEYSAVRTLHGLTSVEVATGHHRAETPRLTVNLPPSGPWWARWYVYMPDMQAAGHGINEVRWHAKFPDTGVGYVNHTTAAGNIGSRLQPDGLASSSIDWDVQSGSAVTAGQWWRIEPSFDGVDLTFTVYAGHSTTEARINTWTGRDVGRSLEITGYRYWRGAWLRTGNNDPGQLWAGTVYSAGDTPVADLQRALMALGYDLSQWEDDGWYGQELIDAVIAFQTDHGYALVDGEAGPETLAGVELAHQGASAFPPLYVSHLAVSDTGPLGPAVAPGGEAVASLGSLFGDLPGTKAAAGEAVASLGATATPTGGRGGDALGALGVAGLVDGTKHVGGEAHAALGVVTDADGTKHAYGQAVAHLGLSGLVEGTKHAQGEAHAALGLTTLATQLIEPVPPVEAVARVVRQPGATIRHVARPAGVAHPTGRLGGHAQRR